MSFSVKQKCSEHTEAHLQRQELKYLFLSSLQKAVRTFSSNSFKFTTLLLLVSTGFSLKNTYLQPLERTFPTVMYPHISSLKWKIPFHIMICWFFFLRHKVCAVLSLPYQSLYLSIYIILQLTVSYFCHFSTHFYFFQK